MPCMCGDSQCRSCGSAQGTLDDGPKRYRLRVEEVGQDDPPADLRYVLGLYIDAPTWEDRLEFEITDRGVAELMWEMDGQEGEPCRC